MVRARGGASRRRARRGAREILTWTNSLFPQLQLPTQAAHAPELGSWLAGVAVLVLLVGVPLALLYRKSAQSVVGRTRD